MNIKYFRIIFVYFLLLLSFAVFSQDKNRVIILTDIENEPDDAQSLVRYLLYSNHFETEGIIATTSCWLRDRTAEWRIHQIVDAYEKVQPGLLVHEPGFPQGSELRKRVKSGLPVFGMEGVGEGKDSEGSEWIIRILSENDERPVWVLVWGGANTLAQSLWKINRTFPAEKAKKAIGKLRVYSISDQDDTGPWIRKNFPGVFYIVSPGYQENNETGYMFGTWTGISGERWYRFPSGADTGIVSNKWIKENIKVNGNPLGEQYPFLEYIMEGDSPSFLYLINNGLGNPEHPDYGSWGGRYELYTPEYKKWHHGPETRPIWTNTEDMVDVGGTVYISHQATIWRWRHAFQNDFAARMAWCNSSYEMANHPPVAGINLPDEISVKVGDKIMLDGSVSYDPDSDSLSYKWFHYFEPGDYLLYTDYKTNRNRKLDITDSEKARASLTAPYTIKPAKMHIILEVMDNGIPSLTRYKRLIVNIVP